MNIFLTGGTGLVGSSVLRALLADGHAVRALARSDSSAETVKAAGADVVRGDLADADLLAGEATRADGVIHTASPGDATSADVDEVLLDAVLGALRDTGKAFVHTSGAWVHGSGHVDESTPLDPPELTAWRRPFDERVTSARDGVRSVLIAPGIVYAVADGHVAGIAGMVVAGPRDDDGALQLPGSGGQHWITVHADDLGRLYARALTDAPAGAYYLGASGENPTVRQIGEATGSRVVGVLAEDTGARLGMLGAALLLDQQATGDKARQELGWAPTQPTLLQALAAAR